MTKIENKDGSVIVSADEGNVFCFTLSYEDYKNNKLTHGMEFYKSFRTTKDLVENALVLYSEISETEAQKIKKSI